MFGLSISQPWAWCIVHGPKRIENRSNPGLASVARTLIGKQVAIHAAKSYDPDGAEVIRGEGLQLPMRVALPAGAIVGVATLERVFQFDDTAGGVIDGGTYRLPEDQLPWTFGPWCLALADVRAIAKPVPCRGQLGFWMPPYDIERQVLAQLEVTRG